jgi:hypothetical protein
VEGMGISYHMFVFKLKKEYELFNYLIKNEGKCPHFEKIEEKSELLSNVETQQSKCLIHS